MLVKGRLSQSRQSTKPFLQSSKLGEIGLPWFELQIFRLPGKGGYSTRPSGTTISLIIWVESCIRHSGFDSLVASVTIDTGHSVTSRTRWPAARRTRRGGTAGSSPPCWTSSWSGTGTRTSSRQSAQVLLSFLLPFLPLFYSVVDPESFNPDPDPGIWYKKIAKKYSWQELHFFNQNLQFTYPQTSIEDVQAFSPQKGISRNQEL